MSVSLAAVAQTGGSPAPAAPAVSPSVVQPQIIVQQPTQTVQWPNQSGSGQRTVASETAGSPSVRNGGAAISPTEFQQLVAETAGRILPIFGQDLFQGAPSTFAPISDAPVTGDYVIGPGDEIRISATGQINQQGVFTVDRLGDIAIPEVGTVHVAGLRSSQLNGAIRSALGRVYRNFDLNVSLGQLRSIQVFVTGQARQPGSYTISSLSSLLNALFASGGPTGLGSLRRIQVIRAGTTLPEFDLYDVLLRGDKSKDIRLQPGDVIFIPPVGPQVAITGSINRPAIYELKNEATLGQLLKLAGDLSTVATASQVRVESIYNHTERTFQDVKLADAGSFTLHAGDIVSVGSITDRFRDTVTLRGNVANPGRYAWHPGMRVKDLIPTKESLITRAYARAINSLGSVTSDYIPQDYGLNAQAAANANTITAAGATKPVNGLGTSANPLAQSTPTNTAAPRTDVLLPAPDINWDYAVVERQDTETLTTRLLPFRLGDLVLNNDETQNLELQTGDVVTIFSQADLRVPSTHQTRFVHLEGEIGSAGIYSVLPGETLRQLVQRAGGLTPDAFIFASEFTRDSTRAIQQQRLLEYANSLQAQLESQAARASGGLDAATQDPVVLATSAAQARETIAKLRLVQATGRIVLDLTPASQGIGDLPDLPLEDGDRLVIPRMPSTVLVEGQVFSPNAFLYKSNMRVRDYLQMAGGPDRAADHKRMFLVRADGSVLSKQYGNLEHARVYPGDTLVMPPHIRARTLLSNIASLSTIIASFGNAAALVAVVALTR